MKNKTQNPLDEREWNFVPVPDDELEVCFLYEYGRSAECFKARVDKWRLQHSEIIPNAKKFLNRTGAFTFTIGPSPDKRMPAHLFAKSGAKFTPEDKKKADENGKAWTEWMAFSWKASNPDGLVGDDPKVFLFYFPPFPKQAWQAIAPPKLRKRAFPLLTPNLAASGRLHAWTLLAGRDFTEAIKAQEAIQAAARAPMDKAALLASVRRQVEQHILAPALIEYAEGIRRGIAGAVPPNFSRGARPSQVFSEAACREEVRFVINWAESNKAIKKALGDWLKKNRPYDEIKKQNFTTAREYLKKLGAWRLLQTMTAEKACAIIASETQLPLYPNPEQFLKAKAEANELLQRLFPG